MALGVVVGFPLFTALALQYMNAAHSIVFVSLLPLTTAIFAVVRGGENQIYFLDICNFRQSGCFTYMFSYRVKLLLASAIYTCLLQLFCVDLAMQKAEYFRKNRWMAGDLLGTYFSFADYAACYSFYMPVSFQDVSTSAVAGLVYVSLFSMLIGFFFGTKDLHKAVLLQLASYSFCSL